VRATILGAGLSGLYAAWRLNQRRDLDLEITILEKTQNVGGLCRSFECERIQFDLGSHRLHPSCRPEILDDLKQLLGNDLLLRPRRGRIHVLGRFLDFPLDFKNLVMNCPLSFTIGVARDTLMRIVKPKKNTGDSFAETMLVWMGKTICERFYFPMAGKMWGLEPEQISSKQALVRTKSSGLKGVLSKILVDLFSQRNSKSCFFYPRKGMGQIAGAMSQQLEQSGVTIYRGIDIKEICYGEKGVQEVRAIQDTGESFSIQTDLIFSTIPLSQLIDLLYPVPEGVRRNDESTLNFRSMLFLFLLLPTGQITPFDAHYFPESHYCFTRISEPKNYGGASRPGKVTGLCVEIPCAADDEVVQLTAEALEVKIRKELSLAGVVLPGETKAVFRILVPNAYPIYHLGYEQIKRNYLNIVSGVKGLISFGRCGLFVHDNIHHTMAMAYEAVRCLEPGGFWNSSRWEECLKSFESFVVED
jgi:protoporphyrinogen oxidase